MVSVHPLRPRRQLHRRWPTTSLLPIPCRSWRLPSTHRHHQVSFIYSICSILQYLYAITSAGQDLIRRELDSRILASSTVNDRNLLPSPHGIPPPAGPLPANGAHLPSSFNHAPTSPMMIPTCKPASLLTSSTSLPSNAHHPSNPVSRFVCPF